jgi:hypothetical protein
MDWSLLRFCYVQAQLLGLRFLDSRRAVTSIEYALIAALIAVAIISRWVSGHRACSTRSPANFRPLPPCASGAQPTGRSTAPQPDPQPFLLFIARQCENDAWLFNLSPRSLSKNLKVHGLCRAPGDFGG